MKISPVAIHVVYEIAFKLNDLENVILLLAVQQEGRGDVYLVGFDYRDVILCWEMPPFNVSICSPLGWHTPRWLPMVDCFRRDASGHADGVQRERRAAVGIRCE